jgi:putative copper export protein/mono/diheme cytochrome c family protein
VESVLIAARWVHFAATISLAGTFALLSFVVGAQPGPARLDRRLIGLAWASLGLALASGAVWLVLVAAQMSGMEPAALSGAIIAIVLERTRFGQVWMIRLILAAMLALLLLAPRRWRRGVWRWTGLAFAAGMLGLLAWAGHGASTPGAPGDLHLAADVLHLLAAGAWVGGLLPLALLLAESRREGEAGMATARRAVRRFSLLAAIAVVLLLAGGLINTWFLAGSVPTLIGTDYGRLVLGKLALLITMVAFGAINLLRMSPRLAPIAGRYGAVVAAAIDHLRRNALVEVVLGLGVLGIVAVLGTLPPGLHTEAGWPLPFRLDLALLSSPSRTALTALAAAALGLAFAAGGAAAAGRYRSAGALSGALALCAGGGWLLLQPGIEPAYPTTFYSPTEAYAAASVMRGATVYRQNCALCHGADGRGDGSAAATLSVRPADLTAPHLLAHPVGDLFWWVSHGKGDGAMPGFAPVIPSGGRWDVINFVRARAAGAAVRTIGPQVSPGMAPPLPDFAFEWDGAQQTLGALLHTGPVLLAVFGAAVPPARLAALADLQQQLAASGLAILAIELAPATGKVELHPPLAVAEADVSPVLALFRAPDDGGETDLLLDRSGQVRTRTSKSGETGLADQRTLAADLARIASVPAAGEEHAGHAH